VSVVDARLRRLGFSVRNRWQRSATVPAGLVIAVSPTGRQPIGSLITVLGSGPATSGNVMTRTPGPGHHRKGKHSPGPSPTGKASPSPKASSSPSQQPTSTPSPGPTGTPSPSPTQTPTSSPTQSPTGNPSPSGSASPSPGPDFPR